jgi:serine/threonine-protein kinase
MAGDVVADRYELEQLVGSGGMSSVFRAHDRVLERTVALKILHERLIAQQDVVDRFSREARMVASLSHHNIVAVIDRGDHDGSPFIVFEYIPGENLKQLVGRTGPLDVEHVLELGIEIASGLEFAHQKGLVHRDVKPQNVLLNGNGEAKVTDFGIARPVEAEGHTQTGTVLGSCDYISPEQAQGRHVDAHTDIYSLGIVLYELLTGKVPFTGENFVAVAMQHINAPPPPVTLERPEVPRRLEAAIEKALSKDPAARFDTMADFRAELEACLVELRSHSDTSATGILPAVVPPRAAQVHKRRRARRLVPLLLIVLGLAVAGVVYAVTRHGSSNGTNGGSGGGGGTPVSVQGVASYDPFGDDHVEDPQDVGKATDGKLATYWQTEHYTNSNFGNLKSGVGLVLDAGAPIRLKSLTVHSTTPGYRAVIKSGDSSSGPFSTDSAEQDGSSTTTFSLTGNEARYYLIWLTNLGPEDQVRINEVTAGSQ